MAHRIVWSRRAVQDLDTLIAYIAADSPAYAGVVLKNIVNQTRVLARFPRAGVKCLNLTMKTCANLSSTATGLFYRLQDDEALIVAVIHGKRILQ
jgi:plasmid stabilization system protein ParE